MTLMVTYFSTVTYHSLTALCFQDQLQVKAEPCEPPAPAPALPVLPPLAPGPPGHPTVKQEPLESACNSSTTDAPAPALPTSPPDPPTVKQEPNTDIEPPPLKKQKSNLSSLLGDCYIVREEEGGQPKTILHLAQEEVQLYLKEKVADINVNPMEWWKDRQKVYPLLSVVVKSYLCIPGTSVPSERIFSTAGDIVSAQRACLKAQNVDMMIFFKKNQAL